MKLALALLCTSWILATLCLAVEGEAASLHDFSRRLLRSLSDGSSKYSISLTAPLIKNLLAAGYDSVTIRQSCRHPFSYSHNEGSIKLQLDANSHAVDLVVHEVVADRCKKWLSIKQGYVSSYEILMTGSNNLRLSCVKDIADNLPSDAASVQAAYTLRKCQSFPSPVDATAFCSTTAPSLDGVDIAKFSPQIRIHPKDEYLPSDFEYGMEEAQLCNGGSCIPATEENWAKVKGAKGWTLQKPEKYFKGLPLGEGQRVNAPMYVNVRHADNPNLPFVDIQYWFYFPYNGCSNMQIGFQENLNLKHRKLPLRWCNWGVHEGDWEHVAVKVCKDNQRVHSVFYAKHSEHSVSNCAAGECRFAEDTHIVGYSALDTHATYPAAGVQLRQELPKAILTTNAATLLCGVMDSIHLTDLTEDNGPLWEPWKRSGGLIQIGGDSPLTYFDGAWGKDVTKKVVNNPEGLSDKLPCNVAGVLGAGAKAIAGATDLLDQYLLNGAPQTPMFQGWWNLDF